MRSVATICCCMLMTATAMAKSYEFPVDPKAMAAKGHRLYVDDASMKAVIPSLRDAGDRLSTCINPMFIPASGYIDFAPTVTGPHTAQAHRLICSTDNVTLTCTEPEDSQSVVFDSVLADAFQLAPSIDLQDALNVY